MAADTISYITGALAGCRLGVIRSQFISGAPGGMKACL
jgi:hypothetical protein